MLLGLPPELLEKVFHHIEDPEIFLENTDAWDGYAFTETRSSLLYRRRYLCSDENYEYLCMIAGYGWMDLLHAYEKPISDDEIAAMIDHASVLGQIPVFEFCLSKNRQVGALNLCRTLISNLEYKNIEISKEITEVLIKNMKEDEKGFLILILLKIIAHFKAFDLIKYLVKYDYVQEIDILRLSLLNASVGELDLENVYYLGTVFVNSSRFVNM